MADEAILTAASAQDVEDLIAAGLRALDVDEVQAALGPIDLRVLLTDGIANSYDPGAARGADGKLWCLFGAMPLGSALTDTALLWALCTPEMERHPVALTVATQRYVDHARQRFPKLINYVDARNRPSIRWLKRLGFTMEAPQPYGYEQRPFHFFHIGF